MMLSLECFELLLGVTTSGVWEVNGMAYLDVVGEGDVLDFGTAIDTRKSLFSENYDEQMKTHSRVSHFS